MKTDKRFIGRAIVKKDSKFKYAGAELPIMGVYMTWQNGKGHDIFPDGSREFQLSIIGTEWEDKYKETFIHEKELDILELNIPANNDHAEQILRDELAWQGHRYSDTDWKHKFEGLEFQAIVRAMVRYSDENK